MKLKTIFLGFFLLSILCFTSCQDEVAEITDPSEQETIVPSSALATSMSLVTANYGAYDDVIDNSSCFSVQLPVTIIVSDITITIDGEGDFEELLELLEELGDEDDILDFVFPITIIFSDYTEIVIENEEQLESFVSECDNEVDDDVIECVDFVYPISFSVFNNEFDVIDTIAIGSDEELYEFLESLEEDDNALIVSLNYPVSLIYANGDTVEVTSNEELIEAIEAAEEDCGEVEYECNEDNIAELLVQCPWDIDDEYNDFNNYQIIFNADGSLSITEGDATSAIGGSWSLNTTDDGLKLTLSELTAFQEDLGGDWIITECDDDELYIQRGDFNIELEQDCDNNEVDCSVAEINANIVECAWELESNLWETNTDVYVYFTPNGQVLYATASGNETEIGTWDLSLSGSAIFMNLSLLGDFEGLSGSWQVVECEYGELFMVNGDSYIYLDQECDYEVYDCNEEEVELNLKECVWHVINFNGDEAISEYDFDFTPNFDVFVSLNNNIVQEGNWAVSSTPAGLVLSLELQFENLSGDWLIVECEDEGLALIRENDIMVMIQDCDNDSNSDLFECFESFDPVVEVCDNGTDGPYAFDLSTLFDNCQADTITYHTTEEDAVTNVNPIANPAEYVTADFDSTVYARVEINGAFAVVDVDLYVVDCGNSDDCTEGDISDFLQTCEWVPVSYNGDDHLLGYTMVFGPEAVTIEGEGMVTTTTYSVQGGSDAVYVFISGVNLPDIQAIGGDWTVVECSPDRIELLRNDDILVLEQTCQ